MELRSIRAAGSWRPASARRGTRRIAVTLALLMMLSPALAAESCAAECAAGLSVRFIIGSCELSITGLTSPDGSALCSPTVGLTVAGVECTYQPFSGCLGAGGLFKCLARMLEPFVQVEG